MRAVAQSRAKSCRRMPAATATLSDSTDVASRDGRRCVRRETARAQSAPFVADDERQPRRGAADVRAAPGGVGPPQRTSFARGTRRAPSRTRGSAGWWKCAPIALRTTLAFHRSTVPGRATVGQAPNAAAVRMIVPTLPGSWTASSTSTRAAAAESGPAERRSGNLRHREDPLRRIGVGCSREVALGHLSASDAPVAESAVRSRRGVAPRERLAE